MKNLRTVLLFVPADRPDFFTKAASSAADTLIFDLEDAVNPEQKEKSRLLLERSLAELSFQGRELAVRLNPLSSPWGRDDLSMVLCCDRIKTIVIPKADPAEIKLTEQLLGNSAIKIICLIETARGLQLAYETASASSRVDGLMLGAEDLAADMNLRRTPAGQEIRHARHIIAMAAYAAAVQPIDTPYLQVDDLNGLRLDTLQARELGFTAKAALSPRQISVIRDEFRPSPEEVEKAKRILEAAGEAKKRGRGVVTLDGAMIDQPVIARAVWLLDFVRKADSDGQ